MELQNSQIAKILYQLLKLQGVKVVEETIQDKLFSHPEFPSLTSFSDVCKEINVSNITLETSLDKIQDSYCPFIAHMISDGGYFVTVYSIDKKKNEISYYHPIHKDVKENIDTFSKKWSRIIFCTETNNNSGEENYKVKLLSHFFSSTRIHIFIASLIFLLLYPYLFISRSIDFSFVLLFSFKLIGFSVCLNLVINDIWKKTALSEKVCKRGKHTGCEDVLNSPASKIGNISMSDIGIIYFTGGIFSLVLSIYFGQQPIIQQILSLLALCSIPYIIFSILYQALKVKKWCPFCLSVISILLLECSLSIFNIKNYHNVALLFQGIILCGLCFVLIAESWYILKYMIIQVKENRIYKYAYLRLKKNPMIYNACFDITPSMDMDYNDKDLILGNKEAEVIITVILNTQCGMCARAHQRMKNILKEHNHNVKLVNRFILGGNNDQETLHLIELYYEKGEDFFEKALDNWYQTLDYGLLVKKYPVDKISSLAIDTLLRNQAWAKSNNIETTPVVILNGKKVEKNYDIDDVQWLVHNTLAEIK